MNRLSTFIWMLVIVVSAILLYSVKYQVQSLKQQVAETAHELEQEKESLHVIAAEWAYLNRPQRLQQLADRYLSNTDLTVNQIAEIQSIPFPQTRTASAKQEDDDITPVSAKFSDAGDDQ